MNLLGNRFVNPILIMHYSNLCLEINKDIGAIFTNQNPAAAFKKKSNYNTVELFQACFYLFSLTYKCMLRYFHAYAWRKRMKKTVLLI